MKREYPFAIIEKLGKELAGEDMNEKINVLDVNIDSCTAKEAMKETIAFSGVRTCKRDRCGIGRRSYADE